MIYCIPASWYAIFAPACGSLDVPARIRSLVKLGVLRPE